MQIWYCLGGEERLVTRSKQTGKKSFEESIAYGLTAVMCHNSFDFHLSMNLDPKSDKLLKRAG
jgi:hypothetical protein